MAAKTLPKNQREILAALQSLRGSASTRQIAEKLGNKSVNGVAQSLGALQGKLKVKIATGSGGDTVWELL